MSLAPKEAVEAGTQSLVSVLLVFSFRIDHTYLNARKSARIKSSVVCFASKIKFNPGRGPSPSGSIFSFHKPLKVEKSGMDINLLQNISF